MDAARQREIASKGGTMAHLKGTAHKWTPEEAREAGRKGGEAGRRRASQVTGSQVTETREPAEVEGSIWKEQWP